MGQASVSNFHGGRLERQQSVSSFFGGRLSHTGQSSATCGYSADPPAQEAKDAGASQSEMMRAFERAPEPPSHQPEFIEVKSEPLCESQTVSEDETYQTGTPSNVNKPSKIHPNP